MKSNSIKMYNKCNCLRIEMTINDPREFKVYKKVQHKDGTSSMRWVPSKSKLLDFSSRTRAMHLYMAGVALPIVSEWLGHSSEETTQIYYAKATDEMKRQAQRKLSENTDSVFKEDIAFKYADDEEMIRRLCGLK